MSCRSPDVRIPAGSVSATLLLECASRCNLRAGDCQGCMLCVVTITSIEAPASDPIIFTRPQLASRSAASAVASSMAALESMFPWNHRIQRKEDDLNHAKRDPTPTLGPTAESFTAVVQIPCQRAIEVWGYAAPYLCNLT